VFSITLIVLKVIAFIVYDSKINSQFSIFNFQFSIDFVECFAFLNSQFSILNSQFSILI